eukprot:6832428-Pyramimonas_sp.AAC.1
MGQCKKFFPLRDVPPWKTKRTATRDDHHIQGHVQRERQFEKTPPSTNADATQFCKSGLTTARNIKECRELKRSCPPYV